MIKVEIIDDKINGNYKGTMNDIIMEFESLLQSLLQNEIFYVPITEVSLKLIGDKLNDKNNISN